jgi:hypothetical protein
MNRNWFPSRDFRDFDLLTNKRGPFGVAGFFDEVGVDKPGDIVVRLGKDAIQKRIVIGHGSVF